MKILGVIPSRYASSRFPGKPLADIGNKTMIQRVYAQASQSKLLDKVIVATDHPLIEAHVQGFGGNVMMTSDQHRNGTERIHELVSKLDEKYDAVVNIQGDEPFIHPDQIDLVCKTISEGYSDIATVAKKISLYDELYSSDTVKVIFNKQYKAIYFSRQAIPFLRGVNPGQWLNEHSFYKHIGLYAYKSDILKALIELKPSNLEEAESLEQLRWLEAGYHICIGVTNIESFGIDRIEDIERALNNQ